MNEHLISVIIPVFNAEKYIADAIDSVFRQKYPHVEVIVINDGSTDGTRAVLETCLKTYAGKIQVIHQENHGQAHARNVGLNLAHGTVIGMLDADDIWPDDHISMMLPYLTSGEYDLVRGLTRFVKDSLDGTQEMTQEIHAEALVGACLYTRAMIDMVGLFDETMHQGEDFDWNIRIIEAGCRERRLDTTALLYRRHENNLTNSVEFVKLGQIHAFRKKIARTRSHNIAMKTKK